jgi:hypothetical protein
VLCSFFSSVNVISHGVSNFQGGVSGLVLYRKCISLCDSDFRGEVHIKNPLRTCADFNSSIANLFVNETPGSHIILTISV